MEKHTPERKKKSGSETRRQTKVMGFRADPVEEAEIKAAAERAGLTVGSYIRAKVIKKPTTGKTRRPSLDRVLLSKLLGTAWQAGEQFKPDRQAIKSGGAGLVRRVLQRPVMSSVFLKKDILKALRRPDDNQGQRAEATRGNWRLTF